VRINIITENVSGDIPKLIPTPKKILSNIKELEEKSGVIPIVYFADYDKERYEDVHKDKAFISSQTPIEC
jgi:hypothetical protein